MGGVYYLLQGSAGFDNLMHGKSPKKDQKQRSLEDFGKFLLLQVWFGQIANNYVVVSLQRVSTQHEKTA
jgi:H+-transporting ATPase